jgi:hypothetical protein
VSRVGQHRTVREALLEWGWELLIPCTTHSWTLDHSHVGEGFPHPVIPDGEDKPGRIFVSCGMADVLFKLPGIPPYLSHAIYVVRDDEEGRLWSHDRRDGKFIDHSPRPGPFLRVVESG